MMNFANVVNLKQEKGIEMKLTKENLHRILVFMPAFIVAVILRSSGLIGNSATFILIFFDFVGAYLGCWWLIFSDKIAIVLSNKKLSKHDKLLRILKLFYLHSGSKS